MSETQFSDMSTYQETKVHYDGTVHKKGMPWCTFAKAGSFNHECCKPATHAAVKGDFRTGRCARCARIQGGENAGFEIVELEGVL